MNKNVPSIKSQIAKRMVSGKKYMQTPPHTPRQPKKDLVYGHHGLTSKNLTARKDKVFTKTSSNGAVRKVSREAAGYEN